MPGRHRFATARSQKIGGIEALKRDFGARARINVCAKIAIHELRVVSVVSRTTVQLSVRVMDCEVKRGGAEQSREPGHRFFVPAVAMVEALVPAGQNGLVKIVTDFYGMTARTEAGPEFGLLEAKLLQPGM